MIVFLELSVKIQNVFHDLQFWARTKFESAAVTRRSPATGQNVTQVLPAYTSWSNTFALTRPPSDASFDAQTSMRTKIGSFVPKINKFFDAAHLSTVFTSFDAKHEKSVRASITFLAAFQLRCQTVFCVSLIKSLTRLKSLLVLNHSGLTACFHTYSFPSNFNVRDAEP